MRVKVPNNITYFEARKVVGQKHETSFSKIVQSTMTKPIANSVSTQFLENDFTVSASTKTFTPTKLKKSNKLEKNRQASHQSLIQNPRPVYQIPEPVHHSEIKLQIENQEPNLALIQGKEVNLQK